MVGWDGASAWSTPANVNAIRNSHLPVLGMGQSMGQSGDLLFIKLGLSYNGAITSLVAPQTQAALVNPLQTVMRAPFPILMDSNTCYSFWGFQNYASNMTVLAKNLFRNMAANTNCNYPQFVPVIHK